MKIVNKHKRGAIKKYRENVTVKNNLKKSIKHCMI